MVKLDFVLCGKMYFAVTCENPAPVNGGVNPAALVTRQYFVGDTVDFTCDSGYSLNGAGSATCQGGGSWSVNSPTCVPGTLSSQATWTFKKNDTYGKTGFCFLWQNVFCSYL